MNIEKIKNYNQIVLSVIFTKYDFEQNKLMEMIDSTAINELKKTLNAQ
ncbi:MAG TPA: hypothetical protein PLN63_03320 [Paludibacteraceae bacterium]|jgi:hypothetical protein|nr:hypothetical protein [Paludibacteraceae bacterium]HOU68267.1 hypothetical protein [Paludibacteraceae bacterium]HPH62635.1 hypothetical protein [Paludibacteraceae bacterium]HQF50116.1 hypothetical protein [Paludibacteraceae bacterium]HQJ89869.1 hypothetical protein [Paludibacteraceae bacterium]